MEHYTNRPSRRHRRNQRRGLVKVIGILSAMLLVLLVVLLFHKEPKIALYTEVTMEAGGALPSAREFLMEEDKVDISYWDASKVNTNVPGVYDVTLLCNDQKRHVKLNVKDTTNPTGKVQNLTALSIEMPTAEDFVIQMYDLSAITVSYVEEPDKNLDGEQIVTIALTDAYGNVTHLQAVLTLIIDREPPVISGVRDVIIYEGEGIDYLTGVTITDNMTAEPELKVDRSQVNQAVPGEYTVTYLATDEFGNQSESVMKVTVLAKKDGYVTFDVIYEEVDAILAEIITPDMNAQRQVWAIYVWIRTNCHYISHSDKDDWMQAAHLMMTERKGDCFNYYSLTKLMLDRLGIPNIDVRKVKNYEGDNDHYWSLVSVDGGETYYHVDATPRSNPASFCLVTDAYMDEYSAKNGKCFNRDKSLYPATPEDPL